MWTRRGVAVLVAWGMGAWVGATGAVAADAPPVFTIATVAGGNKAGFSGDGGPASRGAPGVHWSRGSATLPASAQRAARTSRRQASRASRV